MPRNTASDETTYVPQEAEHDQLARIVDFMAARERAGHEPIEPKYFLSGAEPGERVELTHGLYSMLRQIVDAMERGLAVTVAPTNHVLTTQQVGDLLGVSRPTVIKLLDKGEMPYEKIGTHRRIRLTDALEYRDRRRAAQYEALAATAVDDAQDPERMVEHLREARRIVSARRRGGS